MSEEKENKWTNFRTTNPEKHDENEFIYLVHMIQNPAMGGFLRDIIRINEGGSLSDKINLCKNPNKINEMETISCSLIGKGSTPNGIPFEQLDTWANVGLILKVPYENILRCGTSDLGANFVDPKSEIEKHKNDDKGDPYNLLLKSLGYNEVVVMGGNIEIQGVLLNEFNSKPTEWDKNIANALSHKTGKDIITIKRKEIKLEDKPIEIIRDKEGKLDRIEFTKNDREFYCNLGINNFNGLTWGIYATGDYGEPFIKTEEDLEIFIDELKKLPQDQKEEYADVLELIEPQFRLCQEYFNSKDEKSKDEVLKKIAEKNEILAGHNLPSGKKKTNLQQKETELHKLEEEEKTISDAEALLEDQTKKGQDIGE